MNVMEEDVVQQFITRALRDLPYPVSQPPGDAAAETWVTWLEAGCTALTAGNEPQRARHLIQLHAWTKAEDDDHRAAFFAAVAALKKAGVRVYSRGADVYENDTKLHHIYCTLTWWQPPDAMAVFRDEEDENGEPSGPPDEGGEA
ncbi:MAG: hypothetical protein IKP10_05760 [Clostridia bacterium]|nr:hypothetical protein [Clostridia bacterium]